MMRTRLRGWTSDSTCSGKRSTVPDIPATGAAHRRRTNLSTSMGSPRTPVARAQPPSSLRRLDYALIERRRGGSTPAGAHTGLRLCQARVPGAWVSDRSACGWQYPYRADGRLSRLRQQLEQTDPNLG